MHNPNKFDEEAKSNLKITFDRKNKNFINRRNIFEDSKPNKSSHEFFIPTKSAKTELSEKDKIGLFYIFTVNKDIITKYTFNDKKSYDQFKQELKNGKKIGHLATYRNLKYIENKYIDYRLIFEEAINFILFF